MSRRLIFTMRSIGEKTRMMPGPFGLGQDPAEPEDDAALVFPEDLDGVQDVEDDDPDDDDQTASMDLVMTTPL